MYYIQRIKIEMTSGFSRVTLEARRPTGQCFHNFKGKLFPNYNFVLGQITNSHDSRKNDILNMRGLKKDLPSIHFSQEAAGECAPSKQRSEQRRMQKMEGATEDSCKGLMVERLPGCSQSLLIYLR